MTLQKPGGLFFPDRCSNLAKECFSSHSSPRPSSPIAARSPSRTSPISSLVFSTSFRSRDFKPASGINPTEQIPPSSETVSLAALNHPGHLRQLCPLLPRHTSHVEFIAEHPPASGLRASRIKGETPPLRGYLNAAVGVSLSARETNVL